MRTPGAGYLRPSRFWPRWASLNPTSFGFTTIAAILLVGLLTSCDSSGAARIRRADVTSPPRDHAEVPANKQGPSSVSTSAGGPSGSVPSPSALTKGWGSFDVLGQASWSLACGSRSFCLTDVSDGTELGGNLLHWDGTVWSSAGKGGVSGVEPMACAGDSFCLSLGESLAYQTTDGGRTWRAVGGQTPWVSGSARTVACASPTVCIAEATNPAGERAAWSFDGSAWTYGVSLIGSPSNPPSNTSISSDIAGCSGSGTPRCSVSDGTQWWTYTPSGGWVGGSSTYSSPVLVNGAPFMLPQGASLFTSYLSCATTTECLGVGILPNQPPTMMSSIWNGVNWEDTDSAVPLPANFADQDVQVTDECTVDGGCMVSLFTSSDRYDARKLATVFYQF